MVKKYFETLLVMGLVLIFMFLTWRILYLKNQINMYSHYTGRFKGTDDDHRLFYTYLSPTRDEWQFPEQVIEAIGIRQGDVIADIGAGSGYFTFKFARAVGPQGKVYALEIDDLAINIMKEIVEHSRIKGVSFDNIIIMKTKEDSVGLDEDILDIAFMYELHFYRYENLSEDSKKMIQSIYKSLKKGGKLAIIEKRDRDNVCTLEIIRRHFESRGFKFVRAYDFLPLQLFAIFEK